MTRPAVLFPDAEAITVNYLRTALDAEGDAVPVLTRVPEVRPGVFVLVERVGGVRSTLVTDTARLDVQAWAASGEQAADVAALARTLLLAIPPATGGAHITRVIETAGPQWLPDDQTGTPRYVLTVEITFRGEAL
jgi:hypothetical protein